MGVEIVGGCVLAWLAALSAFDIKQRRLPNWLTLPGAVVVVVGAVIAGRGTAALGGGLALFAAYLLVHLLAPAAMGAGDVKLALGIGALTGAFGVDVWLLAALAAPLLTSAVALVSRAKATVPHGPSMCAAAAVTVGVVVM